MGELARPFPSRPGSAYLWVRSMLSSPLSRSCFPPGPATLPSSDWAYVSVTNGRCLGALGGGEGEPECEVSAGRSKKEAG